MGKISVKGFQYDRLFIPGDTISREMVENVCAGWSFIIRYPSYRGTFLSCIERFELALDGERVPDEKVRFCLNGKEFTLPELKDLHREYWFVLADAKIKVIGDEISDGEHTVTVTMYHRIPYTGYHGDYLIWDNIGTKTLRVERT